MTTDPNGKPVVAHLLWDYLPLSQTFVYGHLKNLEAVRPVVMAHSLENLERFPVAEIFAVPRLQRYSPSWLWSQVCRRILQQLPHLADLVRTEAKLLHAHFGTMGVWALPLKRRLGLPLVTSFYGIDMSANAREKRWRRAYEVLFDEGEAFLVEGSHMAQGLVSLGCPEERVRLLRIGVDVDMFTFRTRRLRDGERVRILLCGRFIEKKGFTYALEALSQVLPHHPNIEMRIIGDGELRPEIEGTVRRLGLDTSVTLLGYQPHSVFSEEAGRAHIFMAPSVTASDGDSEGGAPTVLLEAQASGLPVLSTNHADIPEVVLAGKSGLLVPERDAASLAAALIYLVEHHERWADMGRAGRKHVRENHDIRLQARKLEGIYSELLDGKA